MPCHRQPTMPSKKVLLVTTLFYCTGISHQQSKNNDVCLLVSTDGSIHRGLNCTSCPEGYYCKIDTSFWSSSSIFYEPPIPCGSPSYYCPPNSSNPVKVNNGYYSIGGLGPNTRTHQAIAPKGHFARIGELFVCPAGKYGNVTGLTDEDCSGRCIGGYYCPAGSTRGDEKPCGRFQYCPEGSAFPRFVRDGFYTTISYNQSDHELQTMMPLRNQIEEIECPKGHFCHKAVRYQCLPGTYGDKTRETSPNCAGHCEEGYYCLQGSTSAREARCGNPSYFCPKGSKFPKVVEPGYYTLSDEPFDRKTQQVLCPRGYYCINGRKHQCPSGYYGQDEGLSNSLCNGLCLPGYYCEEGSKSNTQNPCGDISVYCPLGSSYPKITETGKYSHNSSMVVDLNLINATMSWQVDCEKGYYCINGSKNECPAGTFNEEIGKSDIKHCLPCPQGYFCPSDPGNPTINATANPCGGVTKYCPEKSHIPLLVDTGYYSVGGEKHGKSLELYRTGQNKCPKGSFCVDGIKFSCPAGTYGNQTGLFNKICSGFCPAGYFCEDGTVEPQECDTNTYATAGNRLCVPCNNPPPGDRERCKTSRLCCSQ